MKSDEYPTYHFANVVDDHLMKITHVLRGVVSVQMISIKTCMFILPISQTIFLFNLLLAGVSCNLYYTLQILCYKDIGIFQEEL